MARGGQVRIWRCVLAGGVQRSSLSVKRTVPAFTGAEASATACPSHGRGICFYRVGDYQIAPLPPQGGKGRCARWAQDIIACDAAERIIFTIVAGSGSGKLCRHSRGNDNDQENAGYVRESAGGSEQVLRLRARDGAFRAPARVTFFFCKKKVTKENHSNLRFKNPLARGGQVQIWRCVLAGGVQRSSLSVKRTVPAFTGAEASATACPSHGRGICFYRVGDYQIAPLPPQGGKGRCALRARGVICLLSRNTREQKSLP